MITKAMDMVTNIHDQDQMLDTLSQLQNQTQAMPPVRTDTDDALQKAILASKQDSFGTQDFATPLEKLRPKGLPVGLKNVGNTCYFNSLA